MRLRSLLLLALRMRRPLPDDAAIKLGKHFEMPGLLEYVARARRRAVGAMFPTSVS